ncbi:MAG: GNAT family N-acetyltransferase [Synechococcus sp.]
MLKSDRSIVMQPALTTALALETISIELDARHVQLLPIDVERDRDFLFQVYSSTREAELSVVGWPEEQKSEFLHLQFDAQRGYYQTRYPQAEYLCVYVDRRPIGRLYLDRQAGAFRILDITLLKQFRRQGIGTAILTSILKLANREKKIVTVLVERYNPALRLYRRLGFRQCREAGVSYVMEWSAMN